MFQIQTCSGWNCKVKDCCLRFTKNKDTNEIDGSENCDLFLNDITESDIHGSFI